MGRTVRVSITMGASRHDEHLVGANLGIAARPDAAKNEDDNDYADDEQRGGSKNAENRLGQEDGCIHKGLSSDWFIGTCSNGGHVKLRANDSEDPNRFTARDGGREIIARWRCVAGASLNVSDLPDPVGWYRGNHRAGQSEHSAEMGPP